MRDPIRIDRILELLRRVWKRNPDLRLGQMLLNCCYPNTDDVYYLEDEELMEELGKVYFNYPKE